MISLAVWRLDREAMNPWRCTRCEAHGPRPHPLASDDLDAERDDDGRLYLPGYRLAPTAQGPLEDARFDACPEHALATWGADLLQLWRLSDGDVGAAARLLGADLSAAMVDAWDLLRGQMGALRELLRARADGGKG